MNILKTNVDFVENLARKHIAISNAKEQMKIKILECPLIGYQKW
jgi:hypothetical protein